MTTTAHIDPATHEPLYKQYLNNNLDHYVSGDRRFVVRKNGPRFGWSVTDTERWSIQMFRGRWHVENVEWSTDSLVDARHTIHLRREDDYDLWGHHGHTILDAILRFRAEHAAGNTAARLRVYTDRATRAREIERIARRLVNGQATVDELSLVLALRIDGD